MARGPGILLGIGLGGFADGIVLHQVLQWHHLASDTGRDLAANITADGAFHVVMWMATAAAVAWLLRRRVPADAALLGWVLVGWGAFHVADEVVFHALLDLHHIRDGANELAYDLAFLAVGLVLIAAGALLTRSASRARRAESHPRA